MRHTIANPAGNVITKAQEIFSGVFGRMARLLCAGKAACAVAGLALVLLGGMEAEAQRLSPLAPNPEWTALDQFQETITRDEFVRLLSEVYAPADAAKECIDVQAEQAVVKTTLTPPGAWTLRFARDSATQKPAPRYWRSAAELGGRPPERPLDGVKIAIDPGHLGGAWARMEERFFQIGESKPVAEGEMTLRVAEHLAPKLRELGAEVTLVRSSQEPVTGDRPESLRDAARADLAADGVKNPRENYADPHDPRRGSTVQGRSELLFYRTSEIRARAAAVNEQIKPDLVLCLHFNAEAWGDPRDPDFVPRNHLHLILNGCYSAAELRNDDVRFEMLFKLLTRSGDDEIAANARVADVMARATRLPPYVYTTSNALHVGDNPYVWARNLLANRLYHAPVVFTEPYVMNSRDVWDRVQAGDYEGEITIAGERRKSIYREYADAVAAGVREYYAGRGAGRK